jgi:hypothetical protein
MSENRVQMPTGISRRWWLLLEALKSAPLQEALEIAREAEAFLSGSDEAVVSQPTRMNRGSDDFRRDRLGAKSATRYLH